MEVLFTMKVPIFDCNHLAKYNYSVFCKRRLVSIINKQWSGSSTRPRCQLLTSRQAQDLLSTLLDGDCLHKAKPEKSVEQPRRNKLQGGFRSERPGLNKEYFNTGGMVKIRFIPPRPNSELYTFFHQSGL